MELGPLFTEQRWNILKHLSKEPLSPLQLAALTGTTISNISQQLRLLEAANLVRKGKVRNSGKGQPRALFSIPEDYAYIVSVMDNFAEKSLVSLTPTQKALVKILSINDPRQREKVEKAYFEIYPYLSGVEALAVDLPSDAAVILITSEKGVIKKFGSTKSVKVFTRDKTRDYIKRSDPNTVMVLYDPENFLTQ